MKQVYKKTFLRLSLETIETEASGGTFSKFSHEFQVVCARGEDEIIYCPGGDFAQNIEIAKVREGKMCDLGHGPLKKVKTIEVGNTFPLKDKYSKALGLTFKDLDGKDKFVVMGCYGIGLTRAMGAIVEVHHDNSGIIWPKSVAPFECHLLVISSELKVMRRANETYEKLTKAGVEVLYDDRTNVTAGEKFADCDLIGIPVRLVFSEQTGDKIELKERVKKQSRIISIDEVLGKLQQES